MTSSSAVSTIQIVAIPMAHQQSGASERAREKDEALRQEKAERSRHVQDDAYRELTEDEHIDVVRDQPRAAAPGSPHALLEPPHFLSAYIRGGGVKDFEETDGAISDVPREDDELYLAIIWGWVVFIFGFSGPFCTHTFPMLCAYAWLALLLFPIACVIGCVRVLGTFVVIYSSRDRRLLLQLRGVGNTRTYKFCWTGGQVTIWTHSSVALRVGL